MKIVWIVVATWVWWTTTMLTTRPMAAEQHPTTTLSLSYDTVQFTTSGASKKSYTDFIEALREKLRSSDVRHQIPVMRERSTVPDAQRFVLVELTNLDGESITLGVDITNAYVVGYRAGSRSFFFRDAPPSATANLFTDTQQQSLQYTGSYPDLQRLAGASRENINLGMPALDGAISSLSRTEVSERDRARSFIVCIQMVSEAARFQYIEEQVRRNMPSTGAYQMFLPNPAMLSLENNWGRLSTAIQQSNEAGAFSRPVQLQRRDHRRFDVTAAGQIFGYIALMLFICRADRSAESHQFSHPLMISSVVDDNDDSTCVYPEPTVHISGRNGLCVAVKDAQYNDGNPIVLETCKDKELAQLWTLKRNGTIQSNGKCLTAYGLNPGKYVMIYSCYDAVTAATVWQISDNGTIINPKSELVLSANSARPGTDLTVEVNVYASRQGWKVGNNSEPFVTSIVGYMDLCLQANKDSTVWLVECASSKAEQKMAIYPDGTIRPQQNEKRCLTYRNNNSKYTSIIALNCSPGSESQRWAFRNDGTIMNLNSGMVMTERNLHEIIIWPVTGESSQKWFPLL